jgi:uncharacterized membrane protein
MSKKIILSFIIVAVSFCAAIYFYPQMPDKMAAHWGVNGQVDGFMSKFWGLFLMPIISLVMMFLFLVLPKLDPLKENIEKFKKYFENFILLIIVFFFYIYILTILANKGFSFDFTKFLLPAFAVLFFYCGILTENAKRNWFVGVRTPWTLSSDKNWDKTNKLAGKMFKATGIVSLLGVFMPNHISFTVVISLIIVMVIAIVVYSYLEFIK